MHPACNKCGYESPDSDNFCRQCGGQLSTESAFSSAPTMAQVKVESNRPAASINTGRFPPGIGDAIANETERFNPPPQYAQPPGYFAPPLTHLPQPQKSGSSWFKSISGFFRGLFFFLLIAGLVGATGAAVFFSQEARRERESRYQSRDRADSRIDPNRRAQIAWEQMEDAIKLAGEAAEKANDAGAMLSVTNEKAVDLSKYAYPGAQVEAVSNRPGSESLSWLVRDKFDLVYSHYERQFGKPVMQVLLENYRPRRSRALFQLPTPPTILIKVEERERDVKVTILHAPLRFPRSDGSQFQNP